MRSLIKRSVGLALILVGFFLLKPIFVGILLTQEFPNKVELRGDRIAFQFYVDSSDLGPRVRNNGYETKAQLPVFFVVTGMFLIGGGLMIFFSVKARRISMNQSTESTIASTTTPQPNLPKV